MKLFPDTAPDLLLIASYDAAQVRVNQDHYAQSLIVTPTQVVAHWANVPASELTEEHMQQVVALKPALVLLGTGTKQIFPEAKVLRPLVEAGIGFEVMDTGSACRTYNLLAMEGRAVAAALLLG